MSPDGIIRTAIGGLVSIKVLETGMKVINRNRNKIKGGLLFAQEKKKKENMTLGEDTKSPKNP